MNSIVYVGMDVHASNYTLSCYTLTSDECFATVQMEPDVKNILTYLKKVQRNLGTPCEFRCGYEAGALGFSLYYQLQKHGIPCTILAPSTMPTFHRNEIKTDRRDAMKIARCLAFGAFRPVHIPTKEDAAVKDFIRMRDDHKIALKKIKQQIQAFCMRYDLHFTEGRSYWTQKHLAWLKGLPLDDLLREVLDEYLVTLHQLADKIEHFDARIEELAQGERYAENVKKLSCLIGVRTHTALALVAETGDFRRFAKAEQYAAFLGLVPGERSSGDKQSHTGITKAGNTHLRRLLIEASQCYGRGKPGYKSRLLKERQQGNTSEDIAYADKANERLRRKFYRMVLRHNKKHNVAVTAVARELSCFIWGRMTGHTAI